MKMLKVCGLAALAFALSCGGGQKGPEVGPDPGVGPTAKGDGKMADWPAEPPLPMDKRIRKGTLDNGMTYYVLEHRKPQARAQLWLGVNAGSLQEDDDQQGLAHFVEHMAFNGTKKYAEQEIVNYLERIGMKFGPDLNAYTSFDQTVYMLQVPTDDKAIVTKGFDILHQWAHAVAFDPKEVEKERGVVLEEWRLGRGAWKRIIDKQYPVLFRGSKYAKRLPIGKSEIIKGAPRAALTRYYQDWYRPDLMAIVAVGDFDGAAIEKEIIATFSDLKPASKPRPRQAIEVPAHDQTLVSIETDPEMTSTRVAIYNKFPHRSELTKTDYRRMLTEQLYHSMLGERLQEIRQRPGSPITFAWSSTSSMVRSTDAFMRSAGVKDGRIDEALAMLFQEVLRVERHGFSATELERAKKSMIRGYERSVK
ncbi:MAG: insulinase family protein, partial [Deltaproteobacteria bacterium]|nr:insulinase family protein [Deltaproteobacteria bacterium]